MSKTAEDPARTPDAIGLDATISGAEAGAILAMGRTLAAPAGELATLVSGDALRPGAAIGRFVVLSALGEGAMGRVYLAYDPELDRRIALKLLNSEQDRARQLREAQALARVTHPNVVRVYDVGVHLERVWIAMELIVGQTVGAWLAERAPSWREALTVLLDAGRGVIAAHDAGIVHRDLKPENMMVGTDQRVVVMDFGLARAGSEQGEQQGEPGQPVTVTASMPTFSLELTRAGAVIGTPAYMAPEQLLGIPADERSDQFSYCVVLWEAVYGARPFKGETLSVLARDIARGAPRLGSGRAAPSWLRTALVRGLAHDPANRWPSMRALLETLTTAAARRRRRRRVVLVGLLALAPATYGVFAKVTDDRAHGECGALGEAIGEQWNEDTRASLRRGLIETGLGYAGSTYEKAAHGLERWTSSWARVRAEQCVASRVARSLPEARHRLIADCLEDRRVRLGAFLTAMSEADARSLRNLLPAIFALQPPEMCLRDELIRGRELAGGSSIGAEAREVYRALERVRALKDAGRYQQAVTLGRQVLATAESLADPPRVAEARLLLGLLLNVTGEYEEAATLLKRAYADGVALGLDGLATNAASSMISTVGVSLGRREEGLWWGEIAYAQVRRLGAQEGTREASRLSNLSNLYRVAGEFDEARALLERSLEIERRMLGDDHPRVANGVDHMGVLYASEARYSDALPYLIEASAAFREFYGDEHPKTIVVDENLAGLYMELGRVDEAVSAMKRIVAMKERAYGPEHPLVGGSLHNLAVVYHKNDQVEPALAAAERALKIIQSAHGPDHARAATLLSVIGEIMMVAERDAEAVEKYREAIEIYERTLGDSIELARVLDMLAAARLQRGEPEQALEVLNRLTAMRAYSKLSAWDRGQFDFTLAQALVAAKPDAAARARAIALARESLARIRSAGPEAEEKAAKCERWIEAQLAASEDPDAAAPAPPTP